MSGLLDLTLGEKEESEKFTAEELSMGMREAKAKYSQVGLGVIGFRIEGFGFEVEDSGFRARGEGSLGIRVWDLGSVEVRAKKFNVGFRV